MQEPTTVSIDSPDDATAIAALFKEKTGNEEKAYAFGQRFLIIWNASINVKPHFEGVRDCAGKFLDILAENPKTRLCAENLRIIAGQKAKFSKGVRASL